MLFFRSEELIAEWCRARGVTPRPIVRMDQLWHLAVMWYGTRLEEVSRRPTAAEMRGIFESIGLEWYFWYPRGDSCALNELFALHFLSRQGTPPLVPGLQQN